ncbi:MAG TPA: ribonuclease HI family protein [Patescibacteria group bacterium]
MILKVFTDGGSRGNPGVSGFGFVVTDEVDTILYKESKYLGIKTNNEAEYMGLISAIGWLNAHKNNYDISQVHFYSDSQLLVRQMQGIYKIKSENLKPLFQAASSLLSELNLPYQFTDIRRNFNTIADGLANEAMDRRS